MPNPRPHRVTLDVLAEQLEARPSETILDIGCGTGAVAGALARRKLSLCGIDPQRPLIEAARVAYPDVEFTIGKAVSLPYETGRFRHAFMLNALHHVPAAEMLRALREALRVVRDRVVIIEPLAEGPFFEVIRIVDDETELRALAQAALTRGIDDGLFKLETTFEWEDLRHYDTIEAIGKRIIAADPERQAVVLQKLDEIARAAAPFQSGDTFVLPQPHRAHVLKN